MSGTDVIKTFVAAIETQDRDKVKQHLSGDFMMRGWTTEPLNKYQFLDLIFSLKKRLPHLAFHINHLQEDDQFAQSDRVEADIQVTGIEDNQLQSSAPNTSSFPEESKEDSQFQEHVAFAVMGETLESMVATPVTNSSFNSIIRQLRNLSPENDDQHNQKSDNPRMPGEVYSEEQARRYNKQSNLYDPEGYTYTPSRDTGYAPQVDAYSVPQHSQNNPANPLFENAQEQSDLTDRQPDRSEEQKEQ